MDLSVLNEKKLDDLKVIAKALGVAGISKYKKSELIQEIEKQAKINDRINSKDDSVEMEDVSDDRNEKNSENSSGETREVKGILDILPDGFGFLRSDGYDSGDDDIYVPPVQVRRFRLKTGDFVEGLTREVSDKEKFSPLIYVNKVNYETPEKFEK